MRVKLTDPNHPHFAPNPAESVKGNAVVEFGNPPEHIMTALHAKKLVMTDEPVRPNTLPGEVPQEGASAVVRKAAWDTPEREAQARAESEGTPTVFPEPLAPEEVGKPVEARPRPAIVERDPAIWAGVDPATVPSGPENYTITDQPAPTEPDDQGGQVKTDEEAVEAAANKVREDAAEAGANVETEEGEGEGEGDNSSTPPPPEDAPPSDSEPGPKKKK